jgi:hypothetical protein
MICGSCKNKHDTVQEVRNCYTDSNKISEPKATDRQRDFLDTLREERHLPPIPPGSSISKSEASRQISEMLNSEYRLERHISESQPVRPEQEEHSNHSNHLCGCGLPLGHIGTYSQCSLEWANGEQRAKLRRVSSFDIPAGRYAVKSLTGNNDLDFFLVQRPETGKWKGYTFVRRIIGGHPDVSVKGRTAVAALTAIEQAGIEESRTLFGQTIGSCWKCGRHLTDQTSRSLGIGPDCRSQVA